MVNYLKQNPGKTDDEKIELVRTCLACIFDTFCRSDVSPSTQAKGVLAGLAYLHRLGIIHGSVHSVSGLPPSLAAL
jgi:hypothetical protein